MTDAETTILEIELIIEAIYRKFHYDFRNYSRTSLRRRLEQVLIRFNLKTISDIQVKLLHDAEFFPRLLTYLTVNTTELFRDPEYFQRVRQKVIPILKTFPSVKLWVAGCSTGEEVISLSIILKEEGLKKHIIYATDINPMNLEAARLGIFSTESVQKASANYLKSGGTGSLSDYYTAAYDSVKFDPELLRNVVFSDHSLATDAVFSENHFISCRNVMIYFDRDLQERVFRLFKESLVRDGFLGLGNRETMQFSSVASEFAVVDREARIYQKRRTP